MKYTEAYEYINSFKTKSKYGFNEAERLIVINKYEHRMDMDKYNKALYAITCIREGNETIVYAHDICNAVICGLEGRELTETEWD